MLPQYISLPGFIFEPIFWMDDREKFYFMYLYAHTVAAGKKTAELRIKDVRAFGCVKPTDPPGLPRQVRTLAEEGVFDILQESQETFVVRMASPEEVMLNRLMFYLTVYDMAGCLGDVDEAQHNVNRMLQCLDLCGVDYSEIDTNVLRAWSKEDLMDLADYRTGKYGEPVTAAAQQVPIVTARRGLSIVRAGEES